LIDVPVRFSQEQIALADFDVVAFARAGLWQGSRHRCPRACQADVLLLFPGLDAAGVAGIPDLAPVTGLRPALALASGIEIADGALPLTKSRGEDVPARISVAASDDNIVGAKLVRHAALRPSNGQEPALNWASIGKYSFASTTRGALW